VDEALGDVFDRIYFYGDAYILVVSNEPVSVSIIDLLKEYQAWTVMR
jgi:hypothetical protein